MLLRYSKHVGNVITEPQITQSLLHMLASNGFLRFLLADIVGLGGNESDELDTAFHEQVARVLGKGLTGRWGQDLCDYLLDRRCSDHGQSGSKR